jgi:hypothetical protein
MPGARTKNLHLVLSPLELNRLRVLAQLAEVNQSVYLRMLIKHEWEKVPPKVRPKESVKDERSPRW